MQERLRADFVKLGANPQTREVDVKALKGKYSGMLRVRHRQWRAFFLYDAESNRLVVLQVTDRKDAYD